MVVKTENNDLNNRFNVLKASRENVQPLSFNTLLVLELHYLM